MASKLRSYQSYLVFIKVYEVIADLCRDDQKRKDCYRKTYKNALCRIHAVCYAPRVVLKLGVPKFAKRMNPEKKFFTSSPPVALLLTCLTLLILAGRP